jgi:hypothetical protein
MESGEIMTLNECTKEELIFIIKRIAGICCPNPIQQERKIQVFLDEIEYKRTEKLYAEADGWSKKSAEYRRKYADLVEQYEGDINGMPADVYKEAQALLYRAQFVDEKYAECIRKTGGYFPQKG